MIIWTLIWLYIRLEFIIDWGIPDLTIDWLPVLSTTMSGKDIEEYRIWSIEIRWLIIGVVFSYYYPSLFKYDEDGDIVGKQLWPQCIITQIE